jgi:hypothetical protein
MLMCILQQDQDVSRVPSTLSLWKICSVNSWCTRVFDYMKVCTYNEFEYFNVFGYYLNVYMWILLCEVESRMNLNHVWIFILYEFEIFKYRCNLYLSNGVGWLKLVDTKDCVPHPEQRVFGVVCVTTANTKNGHFLYHTKGIRSDDRHQRPVTSWHYKLFL